jgi:Flp pilus assembly protein TadG
MTARPARTWALVAARRARRRLLACDSGVIAIEFALLVPVLLTLFLGGIDTAWLVIAHYKLERAADSLADLTARTQQLHASDVQDIFAAAAMVAKPFDLGADGRVIASSVTNPSGTGAVVDWQQASAGGIAATSRIGTSGGAAELGADLSVEIGETMIVGEAYLDFRPIIGFLIGPQELYTRLYERARYGVVELLPE